MGPSRLILPLWGAAWQPLPVGCRDLAIVAALLVGCGAEPEPASRVGHRAIYALDRALNDLSIARSEEGGTVIAWTEGEMGNGDPAWLELGSGEVHRAAFPPAVFGPAARVWSKLVSTPGGYARFVGQFTANPMPLYQLAILDDVSLESFTALPRISLPSPTMLEAMALPGHVVVVALDSQWQIVAHEVEPEDRALAVIGPLCDLDLRAAKLDDDAMLVLAFDCLDTPGTRLPFLFPVSVNPGPDSPVRIMGDPTSDDLLAMEVARSALGTLWLSEEGRLRLFVQEADAESLDLSDPVLEVEGAQSARLFASEKAFVVTYRTLQGAALSPETTAVTVVPSDREVSEPYEWPLGEDDCPITESMPTATGLEYVCVGRCQGAGCAERWIYHGTVELSY
ncbi:MAG: hypothetical protein HYY06_05225 [Deltaproteobacteria bacterium]|nr:hypothetical protein [Deltaproteobacteria bacterium]